MTGPSSSKSSSSSPSSFAQRSSLPPPRRRRRKPPCPNSVLDRQALLDALDDGERGLVQSGIIKPRHIEGFYQALHRQHYPDLPDFVKNYYRYEDENTARKLSSSSSKNDDHDEQQQQQQQQLLLPLKNAISARKNCNLIQLPRAFLDFLAQSPEQNGLVTLTSRVAQQQTSADGSTTKLAIQLHDGQLVESVIMRYHNVSPNGNGSQGRGRASLCVSSQCGCAMGCTFCATGTMGLQGNLTTGEILEQIVHADRLLAQEWIEQKENNNNSSSEENNNKEIKKKLDLVRNVVFMGMGEPLDNYKNVVEACRALIDRKRWNLAHGRVTVSTVGVVPKIRQLTRELPEVSLALSLHAPNQAMRAAIVPTAKHYPIQDLIDALDNHMMAYLKKRLLQQQEDHDHDDVFTTEQRVKESTRRRAMIEYVMLEGDTSRLECAHELGKLCENRHLVVNLIPYNDTTSTTTTTTTTTTAAPPQGDKPQQQQRLQCPSEEHMNEFRKIVASYGTFCTIRRTMGSDIASACGQLVTTTETTTAATRRQDQEQQQSPVVRDIEDAAAPMMMTKGQGVTTTTTTTKQSPKVLVVRSSKARRGSAAAAAENDCQHPGDLSTQQEVVVAGLEGWIWPLSVATTVAACSFVVSSALFLRQKRS